MAVLSSEELSQRLQDLKQRRKGGEIGLKEYYRYLLGLLSELALALQEEVPNLSQEEITYQLPVVLVFLEEQIGKFHTRSTK